MDGKYCDILLSPLFGVIPALFSCYFCSLAVFFGFMSLLCVCPLWLFSFFLFPFTLFFTFSWAGGDALPAETLAEVLPLLLLGLFYLFCFFWSVFKYPPQIYPTKYRIVIHLNSLVGFFFLLFARLPLLLLVV